jgi:hypothetical protein
MASRAVEEIESMMNLREPWYRVINIYLRDRWASERAYGRFVRALNSVLDANDRARWLVDAESGEKMNAMIAGASTDVYWLEEPDKRAIRLFLLFDENWLPAKRVEWALTAASSSDGKKSVRSLQEEFDSALARMQRCRNAIEHSGHECDRSSQRVSYFARWSACTMIRWAVDAMISQKDVKSLLDDRAQRNATFVALIGAGRLDSVAATLVSEIDVDPAFSG